MAKKCFMNLNYISTDNVQGLARINSSPMNEDSSLLRINDTWSSEFDIPFSYSSTLSSIKAAAEEYVEDFYNNSNIVFVWLDDKGIV